MAKKTPPFPEYPVWTELRGLIASNFVLNPTNGCWEWTKSVSSNGYGQVSVSGKMRTAHRVSFAAFNEREAALLVLHTCDNKKCVNPDHLYEGTHLDNSRDGWSRGRYHKGKDFSCTSTKVYTFKHKDGTIFTGTVNELYSTFKLDNANVWRMVKGKRPSTYGWRIHHG